MTKRDKQGGSSKRKRENDLACILHELAAKNPAIHFVRGNEETKRLAQHWLVDARTCLRDQEKAKKQVASAGVQVKRKTKQEFYGKDTRKGMPPPHVYENIAFCRKELIATTSCEAIKPLTDGEYRLDVDDCHDFERFVSRHDHFLRNIAFQERCNIQHLGAFQIAEIRSWPVEKQLEWYTNLGSPRAQELSDLLDKNALLKDNAFDYSFGCACLHDQTDDTKNTLTAYACHLDKVGNIVCFYGLSGKSYNLIAMPSSDYEGEHQYTKQQAELDKTDTTSYDLYQAHKESCGDEDRGAIEMYEADFLKEATKARLPQVRVFEMGASDKLAFAAAHYLHGTIICKSDDGISRRALLVFHDLIPYC